MKSQYLRKYYLILFLDTDIQIVERIQTILRTPCLGATGFTGTLPGTRRSVEIGCRRVIAEQRKCGAKLGFYMQFSQLLKVFNFENRRVPKIIRIL